MSRNFFFFENSPPFIESTQNVCTNTIRRVGAGNQESQEGPPGASATLACLHESKLQHVDRQRIIEAVGLDFAGEYAFLPAEGTRGRIILAASSKVYSLSNASSTANTISAKITNRDDGFCVEWPQVKSPRV
jgi:hypothetical protein